MTEADFKIALLKARLSQHQLAQVLGVHPTTISRIVGGTYIPPAELQEAFRAALGEHGTGLVFGYRLKDDNSPSRAQKEER